MPSVFNLSIPQLRQWSRRQPVDHRLQNEPVAALNQMTTGIAPPRMKAGARGIAAGTITAQFKLTPTAANLPDHLLCRSWDGETQGTEIIEIAKPYLLRRNPWDGRSRAGVSYRYTTSVERIASMTPASGYIQEIQVIVPSYFSGDIIYASRPIAGGVSVDSPDDVEWLDDNRDGRAWARRYIQ